MYLLGDIGNTETKICVVNSKKKIIKKIDLQTKKISRGYFLKKTVYLKKNKLLFKQILFSSVVPNAYKKIKKILISDLHLKSTELKETNLKNFIRIKVNKKQVGSDRLANAIGISDKKNNFIVLDLGTATTFDVIIKNQYLGGIIAPGINLSLKSLSRNASLIPSIKLSKVKKVVGKNTKLAVQSGFYWGYIGLVKNIIKLIKKETKKSFKVVLTGGFSNLFNNIIKEKIKINKNLTIYGLLKVATKNEK